MQTHIAPAFLESQAAREAEAILRRCVHCGFCTATCPTYQLLGNELDSPRGRIYLIKQVLEGAEVTHSTLDHLDRCLTCRNCETTCPSGVEYGHLVDIGRQIVDERVQRPAGQRAVRWLLKEGLTSPAFGPALKVGQQLRGLLPSALRDKIPVPHAPGPWPTTEHPRKVLLPAGCVQPAMHPGIDAATARVLDAAGIQVVVPEAGGCCGALRTHLGDVAGGLSDARRNIDAWWPHLESGRVEAIISNASGCGVSIKDYGHALAADPVYAERARRVGALTRDLSELLPDLVCALHPRLAHAPRPSHRLVFHPPCTLQHGQKLRGGVETQLRALGFDVHLPATESHLCCGSAGTFSVLQAELAGQLRERKLGHVQAAQPDVVISANMGCIQHLQAGTETPVRHWIEVLDEALRDAQAA